MSHLYFNEESDYSEENTCENEVFRSTILHHKKKLNIFTPQLHYTRCITYSMQYLHTVYKFSYVYHVHILRCPKHVFELIPERLL